MNIDIFIRKYDIALKDIENKKNTKIDSKTGKTKKKNVFTEKIYLDGFSIFLLAALSFFCTSYIILLYKNELVYCLYSFGIIVLLCIVSVFWGNRESKIRERLQNDEVNIKERLTCLISLLTDYHIDLSENRIDSLIKGAKENQTKYDHWEILRKFSRIIKSGSPIIFTVITYLLGNFFVVEQVTATVSFFIVLIFWYFLYLILFASLKCVFISEIDPILRRMYFFHDSFIYDLNQLEYFKEYFSDIRYKILINRFQKKTQYKSDNETVPPGDTDSTYDNMDNQNNSHANK